MIPPGPTTHGHDSSSGEDTKTQCCPLIPFKKAGMSQYLDEIDLTTPEGVLAYLAPTPYASARAEPLSGGTANFIFRLHLITPYQGRPTLILKHARPYVASAPDFRIPVSRQGRKRSENSVVLLHPHPFPSRISKWRPCAAYAPSSHPTRASPSPRSTSSTARTTRSSWTTQARAPSRSKPRSSRGGRIAPPPPLLLPRAAALGTALG